MQVHSVRLGFQTVLGAVATTLPPLLCPEQLEKRAMVLLLHNTCKEIQVISALITPHRLEQCPHSLSYLSWL